MWIKLPIPYKHDAIYIGNNRIVERQSGKDAHSNGIAGVLTFDMREVYHGKTFHIYNRGGETAAQRAEARIGEKGYCLFTKNCWHFAEECTGFSSAGSFLLDAAVGTSSAIGKGMQAYGKAVTNHPDFDFDLQFDDATGKIVYK